MSKSNASGSKNSGSKKRGLNKKRAVKKKRGLNKKRAVKKKRGLKEKASAVKNKKTKRAVKRIVEVRTDAAPAPVGPYSQAVVHGGLVYASGQIPLVPATGKIVDGDVEAQTRQVLDNLGAVLRAAGSGFEHALKVTIFLADIADFPRVNALYAQAFTGDPAPARATVQVAALPLAALVEMDAVARIPAGG